MYLKSLFNSSSKRFLDYIPTYILAQTDWEACVRKSRRAGAFVEHAIGDLNFSHVLTRTKGRLPRDYKMGELLWAYGVLLEDKKSPEDGIRKALPYLSHALMGKLERVSLKKQEKHDLGQFMESFAAYQNEDRFGDKGRALIDLVIGRMQDSITKIENNPAAKMMLA